MAHMKTQLNVELPNELTKRIKKDAVEINVTLSEYAKQAFEKFLSLGVTQRRIFLSDRKQQKILGRRISLTATSKRDLLTESDRKTATKES